MLQMTFISSLEMGEVIAPLPAAIKNRLSKITIISPRPPRLPYLCLHEVRRKISNRDERQRQEGGVLLETVTP